MFKINIEKYTKIEKKKKPKNTSFLSLVRFPSRCRCFFAIRGARMLHQTRHCTGEPTHFLLGKHISYNKNTILHSCYGEHWRHLRRILSLEVVSMHRLNASYDIRRDELMQKLVHVSRNDFTKVDLKTM